jgi:hypothetical protein
MWNKKYASAVFITGMVRLIRSLCFPTLEERLRCIFATKSGSLIRICWDDLGPITQVTSGDDYGTMLPHILPLPE